MDSTDRPMLPAPPKHPSSSRSISPAPPIMPPRPSYYAAESTSLRPPVPPRHPSSSQSSLAFRPAPPIPSRPPPPIPIDHPEAGPSDFGTSSFEPAAFGPSDSNVSLASSTLPPSYSQSDIPEAFPMNDDDDKIVTPVVVIAPAPIPKPDRTETMGSTFEKSLSESELRELYNDEEIDRFLRLFSAHVTEVRLQDTSTGNVRLSENDTGVVFDDLQEVDPAEETDWTSVNESPTSLAPARTFAPQNLCLSERIAFNYIMPILPPPPAPAPAFTIGRMKSTMQRLFLAMEPSYRFFVHRLLHLATWNDKSRSTRYCFGFWVLWLYNLLLPSLILYLLYVLFYRKMHPYPTLDELREHRKHIDKAKEFGEELQMRLTTSPIFGVKEAWRVFRVFNKSRKVPSKKLNKNGTENFSLEDLGESTVLDDSKESKTESDIKAIALEELTQLTDGIERLKNLFLWRRPAASIVFGFALAALFFITLVVPAKYLAKLVYMVIGIAFWHVPPIIIAIPVEDRKRIAPLLKDVPTDADYAMDLISQRIARGQDIKPLRRRLRDEAPSPSSMSVDSFEAFVEEKGPAKPKTKLKKGVAMMTTLAAEGAKMVTGEPFLHNAFAPEAAREATGDTRTYPSQYGKNPGVISLTSTTFFFTTLMSSHAKVTVPLDQITGIKKGFSKAISLQIKDMDGTGPRVERFLWVYERDDLFARLVGIGGRKWLNV